MPWSETDPVTERLKFVAAHRAGRESMTELCMRFGISRKTGYKILARYRDEGPEGLRDRSRAPASHPNQTPPAMEGAILRVRKKHPRWGSKKILAVLQRSHEPSELPGRSTVDAILKRAGVVQPRRRRGRRQPAAAPVIDAHAPNDVWSMDYKGWFRVGDGTRCDPLTVNDVASRASLECRALVAPKFMDVRARLERTFRTFGLPSCILSDNGPPFASTGLGRLSRLGVWLLRLGVRPVFIQPGRPDQNGRHERFHETLKAETANPPRPTIRAQQAAFRRFQAEYNEERPHEALDMQVPADIYEPSPRQMPEQSSGFEYDDDFESRLVRKDGAIRWSDGYVFIGEAMSREYVGLRQVGDGAWHVYLGPLRLGALHERSKTVVPVEDHDGGVTHVPGHV